MKNRRVLIGVILVAIFLMGIGYASLSNIGLTIDGTAEGCASQDNFKVYFTGANTLKNPTDSTAIEVIATNGEISATVNIKEGVLTKKDDIAYAVLEIENGSNDVNASSINVVTQNTDTDYFDITAEMCDSTGKTITDYAVASGAKTYVKVQAKLLKTPTENVNTNIDVKITAEPAAQ